MSPEKQLRIRLIVSLLATMIAAGIVGFLLLKYAVPQYYFRWYPLIPVYFTLLGGIMSAGMWYYSKRMPTKIVTVFMLMRGVKLLLTVGSIFLYYVLVGEQMVEFSLTTAVFYFLYLFVETYLFYRFEKMAKRIRG